MKNMNFSTKRLLCRPLEEKDISAFRAIAVEPHIRGRFDFGDVSEFWQRIQQYECFPLGVHASFNDSLIGYINGFVYSNQDKELLVEFFLTEGYYNFDYVAELLRAFVRNCHMTGFTSFRFELDSDDPDVGFLTNLPIVHGCPEEDYHTDVPADGGEAKGKYIRVFKIFL